MAQTIGFVPVVAAPLIAPEAALLTAGVVASLRSAALALQGQRQTLPFQWQAPPGFPAVPVLPKDPIRSAYDWVAGTLSAAYLNVLRWLNRPAVPPTVGAWPGMTGNPAVSLKSSPRACSYFVVATYFKPNYNNVIEWHQAGLEYDPFYGTVGAGASYILDSVSISQTQPESINGNKVYNVYVHVDCTLPNGSKGKDGRRLVQVTNLVDLKLYPNEQNTSGWKESTNVVQPIPWSTRLPERRAATAPPVPLAFRPPITVPQPEAPSLPTEEVGTGTARKPLAPPIPINLPSPGPTAKPDRRIGPDGRVEPQPRPEPQTTDPDTHWINGLPMTDRGVRPDIGAVAKEVGRIESKLAHVMEPGQARPGSGGIQADLSDMLDLASRIIDLLTVDAPGRDWTLTAPCDRDVDDKLLTKSYTIPADDYGPATIARLDAIMDAMKDTLAWKRKVCGQNVYGPTNNVTIHAYSTGE